MPSIEGGLRPDRWLSTVAAGKAARGVLYSGVRKDVRATGQHVVVGLHLAQSRAIEVWIDGSRVQSRDAGKKQKSAPAVCDKTPNPGSHRGTPSRKLGG